MSTISHESPAATGTPWQLARAAWAVTAVFALSNSPTPLYVYWQDRIGFSTGTLTLVFATYIVGLVLTLLVAGRAADLYGRKRVVIPAIVLALISSAMLLVTMSVAMLLAARLLTGIAVGVVVSAGMAAVVDLGGDQRRQATSTLASISMVFGAGLGPLLGGAVYEFTDAPAGWVFSINAALLASALLGYVGLPLGRPAATPPDGPLWPRLPAVPSQNRRDVASGIAAFAPGLAATSFVLSLGPSLLVLAVGTTSPLLAGGAACLMFLAATVSQLALARLPVRGLYASGAVSTIAAMIAVVLAVAAESATPFVVAAVLAGSGQGLGQLGGLRLIAQHVPNDGRAESNAALNIGAYVPAATLTVATGYAVTGFGMSTTATALAIALGSLALVAGLAARGAART